VKVELLLTMEATFDKALSHKAPARRQGEWPHLQLGRKWPCCEPSWGRYQMNVVFPNFSDPLLTDLSVCAFIDDKELIARFADKIRDDTKYGDEHWARILIGPRERKDGTRGIHFHLDFKRRFGPEKKAPTISLEEFLRHLDPLSGKSVTSCVTGRFELSNKDLPQDGFISSVGDVSLISEEGHLTLTGGTLQYSGEGYDELKWRALGDSSTEIILDAFLGDEFNEQYVIDALDFVRKGLDRFVLVPK
jgi:hypothetical protein